MPIQIQILTAFLVLRDRAAARSAPSATTTVGNSLET